MKKTEIFREACQQVAKEFAGTAYRLTGKNHDRRIVLKSIYSAIAVKFLYHREASYKRYFVANHIWRISEITNIPLNEIASFS